MAKTEYREQIEAEYQKKTGILLQSLPDYVSQYRKQLVMSGKSETSIFVYIQRINVFYRYLQETCCNGKKLNEIDENDLARLTPRDISHFLIDLKNIPIGAGFDFSEEAQRKGKLRSSSSINNYLSAIRSYLTYCQNEGLIKENPALSSARAKCRKKDDVIHLYETEQPDFLDSVKNGTGLSKRQEIYRTTYSKNRDTAICQIFLQTGIRVSELCGINVDDINFKQHTIYIYRKEGKESHVYMSDELERVLNHYILMRNRAFPDTDEKALFLVAIGKYKGQRLSVRSIEHLVKKYALAAGVTDGSSITPHRLRATFAMNLIRATSDISLAQQALSHSSPATTAVYIGKREKELLANRNALSEQKTSVDISNKNTEENV